jgi:predicted nucleotide-binding protein (sugar kinase/HSP70/actin superfamily)
MATAGNARRNGGTLVPLNTPPERTVRLRNPLRQGVGRGRRLSAHFERPVERPFTQRERHRVTILFGGLTTRHELLIHAGLEALGHKAEIIPTPCKADFQTGREYGNNGQCSPTYFLVGALINYLKRLRDGQGLSVQEILDRYVFFTAGAQGPCRFGMYENEYRLALRNSGFDGFRVLVFQQTGGLNQSDPEAGLVFNPEFFLSVINAFFLGDLLNLAAHHIRPYEVEPGSTDRVFAKCLKLCYAKMREKNYDEVRRGNLARLLTCTTLIRDSDEAAKYIDQLRSTRYTDALAECARMIDAEIEVDYTRWKPIVKITGEFWAQTTEGDGNYNMFPFLEEEGAEVLVEPVTSWLTYRLSHGRNKCRDRRGLEADGRTAGIGFLRRRWALWKRYQRQMLLQGLAIRIINREYERLRRSLGGTTHGLVDPRRLERLGHPYYNSRAEGGEGHLEVAKNIYYSSENLAHLVLSLKPFGCLPSTQSDGAQGAVAADYPGSTFLPIETSGEGDISAYSRVQMALGEVKIKCKDEFNRALARSGYTLEQIRGYVAEHRRLRRPLQHVPDAEGVTGRAANYVLYVGRLMDRDARWSRLGETQVAKRASAAAWPCASGSASVRDSCGEDTGV